MKQTYTLEYRNGWGENGKVTFEARTYYDASTIAKNYCIHNFIKVAWLVTTNGKRMAI